MDDNDKAPLDGLPMPKLEGITLSHFAEMVKTGLRDHVVGVVFSSAHSYDMGTLHALQRIQRTHDIMTSLPIIVFPAPLEEVMTQEMMFEKIHQEALLREGEEIMRSGIRIVGIMGSLAHEMLRAFQAVRVLSTPVLVYEPVPKREEVFSPKFPKKSRGLPKAAPRKVALPVLQKRGRSPRGTLGIMRQQMRTERNEKRQQARRKPGRRNGTR